jgi:Viral BACON domain/Fibronectin type III domain
MRELTRSWQSQIRSVARAFLLGGTLLILPLCNLTEAWAIDAAPTSLSFNAVQGGASPAGQAVYVSKNNRRTVSWSSSDSATWLSVSPTTGTLSDSAQIWVTVNQAGLAAGTYIATVTVRASKGGSVSVPVTLTVTPGTSTSPPSGGTSSSNNTVALSWSPNSENDLGGYKLYMGTASGLYGSMINVGKVTSYSISNLGLGTTYYFALSAYDTSGNESPLSTEVSKSIY